MKRCAVIFVTMLLLVGAVAGCGRGGAGGSSAGDTAARGSSENGSSQSAAPMVPPGMPADGRMDEYGGAVKSESAPQPNPGAAVSLVSESLDRKIIMNAELHLKVKDGDDAVSQISSAVHQTGGYVQETHQQGTREQGRTILMTMRVPAGGYNSILSLIAELGEEVTERREWTQDVSAEYFDLEARIKTKETHLEQLRKLYEKGGNIKEMMELEQEIARVTSDLESLKGRYRFLSNQVDFSTISVRLYEPGVPTPIRPPETVLERMKLGFTQSWNQMINQTGNLAVFFVTAVPVILYLLVIGGILYLALRTFRRFRKPPAA